MVDLGSVPLEPGTSLPVLTKPPITKVQLLKYAGASGDLNLAHVDEDTARSAGLGGVIAHGMLSMGFLGEYVEQIAGDRAWVRGIQSRFDRMVRPGDALRCGGEVTDRSWRGGDVEVAVALWVVNDAGDTVTRGSSILQLRSEGERDEEDSRAASERTPN